MRANLLLSSVLVATAFVVGCEWTTSDGIAWDDSYNTVNFSGTYPMGAIIPVADGAVETSGTASATQTINGGSGQLKCSGVQSATVTVYAKDGGSSTGIAETPGALTFDNSNYSGSVGESGAVNASINGAAISKMVVSYTYNYSVPTSSGAVSSITVHQTGQNVTMTLNNGVTFSGRISGFDYNADSIQSSSQVIAKYNVSGSRGNIVGTLTSTTSSRVIDGVMKVGGSSSSFTGSIAGAGRQVGSGADSTGE